MGALATSSLTGLFRSTSADEAWKTNYKVNPWSGDDFSLGHKLRDGDIPQFPLQSEKTVDFVIVGGGMAGLACSHFLRNENALLLEQYVDLGGTSRGGTYRGIDYSLGAVCTGSHDGIYGELFDQLQIKPTVVPKESIAWRYGTEWVGGLHGASNFFKDFDDLRKELQTVPNEKLETKVFQEFLGKYDSKFVSLMDQIARSWYGAGADEIAANAGAAAVHALSSDSYLFHGGNSGIARALARSIESTGAGRLQTSCFAWRVEKSTTGGSVVYSDKQGTMHRVNARHIVVATPPMITPRIVSGLSDKVIASMKKVEMAAEIVVNFCMRKKAFKNPFQSYADTSFPFGQMVLAETPYEVSGTYKPEMGSVLTVYVPYCTGAVGRAKILSEQRERLAESLVATMNKLVDGFDGSLEEVALTRWGHAFPIARPGAAAILAELKNADLEWMTFGHSTVTGSQSFEGAIQAARHSADACLKRRHG